MYCIPRLLHIQRNLLLNLKADYTDEYQNITNYEHFSSSTLTDYVCSH
jgi:hypothetical protein